MAACVGPRHVGASVVRCFPKSVYSRYWIQRVVRGGVEEEEKGGREERPKSDVVDTKAEGMHAPNLTVPRWISCLSYLMRLHHRVERGAPPPFFVL